MSHCTRPAAGTQQTLTFTLEDLARQVKALMEKEHDAKAQCFEKHVKVGLNRAPDIKARSALGDWGAHAPPIPAPSSTARPVSAPPFTASFPPPLECDHMNFINEHHVLNQLQSAGFDISQLEVDTLRPVWCRLIDHACDECGWYWLHALNLEPPAGSGECGRFIAGSYGLFRGKEEAWRRRVTIKAIA